jgi:ABC-type branched-subunit amino acid transport system substrate-binding protein
MVLAIATGGSPGRAEVRIGLAAPLTGNQAWAGGETREGAEIAVADLNARGRVLGERMELITVDDYCDGDQAVAAANKLVASEVVMVFGHQCSGAAIPASKVYAEAGILMVSTFATNPKLTEQGFSSVFRVVGRDDVQGEIAADLVPDPRANPAAAALAERLDRLGAEPAYTAYAAVQVWAQAAEKAGTFETAAVAEALRSHEFDTVLGTIGFDDKGDVTGYDTFVWYQWRGGDYRPVEPGQLTE